MTEQEYEMEQTQEIETFPTDRPQTSTQMNLPETQQQVNDLIYLSDNIDKIISAQNNIRMALLKLAQPGDWILFTSSSDHDGKAELGFAGSMRIGSTLGVSFTNWTSKKIEDKDELGLYYRWEFECDATWKNRKVRAFGRAGTRDKFFGKKGGEFRPLEDIDEGNIMMAARRGAMKEAVKILFGLHHMNPVDLKKYNVPLANARGYEFSSSAKPQQQTMASKPQTRLLVLEKINVKKTKTGKERYIAYSFEGDAYYTFSKTLAEKIKAFIDTNAEGKITYRDTQYGPEITDIAENASE